MSDTDKPKTSGGCTGVAVFIGAVGGYFIVKAVLSILKPESVEYVQITAIYAFAGTLVIAVIATFLSRRILSIKNTPNKLINVIAWSNTITWLFPILGILTSITTAQFSRSEKLVDFKTKYQRLFYLGFLLSSLNFLVSVAITIIKDSRVI